MVSFPDLHRSCLGGCIYSVIPRLIASLAPPLAAYLLPMLVIVAHSITSRANLDTGWVMRMDVTIAIYFDFGTSE
jgi:hypothetical protein